MAIARIVHIGRDCCVNHAHAGVVSEVFQAWHPALLEPSTAWQAHIGDYFEIYLYSCLTMQVTGPGSLNA